jgi:hypothetical protein
MRTVWIFWKEVLRRTLHEYESRESMIGFVLLFLVAAGYGRAINDDYLAWSFSLAAVAYVAFHLALVTPQRMWTESQAALRNLEDRQKPRLRIVFEPDALPYLQHFLTNEGNTERPVLVRHRIYRVGILNESTVTIRRVRVVLESFEQITGAAGAEGIIQAGPDHPVLIEHAFSVMGLDHKHGLVDVAPSQHGKPTAFVNIVDQFMNSDGTEGDFMYFKYGTPVSVPLFTRATYRIGLRVEGAGTASHGVFEINATLARRAIEMRPYSVT